MNIESYDYISGQSLGITTSLNFGDIIQNQHCVKPLVLRFVSDPADPTISGLKLLVQDKGSWPDTTFSYYKNDTFSHIESGSSCFKPLSTSVDLSWDGTYSDYVWLDAQIKQVTGMTQASFSLQYNSVP